MSEGGYVISKNQSKAIQQNVCTMFKQIREDTDKFITKNGDRLWKDYKQKIANGVISEDAFWSVMSKEVF